MRVVVKPGGFEWPESKVLSRGAVRQKCARRLYLLYHNDFSILDVKANREVIG